MKFIKENVKYFIILVLIVLLFYLKLPYYVMCPGGSINVTDRVSVDNHYDKYNGLTIKDADGNNLVYTGKDMWSFVPGFLTHIARKFTLLQNDYHGRDLEFANVRALVDGKPEGEVIASL